MWLASFYQLWLFPQCETIVINEDYFDTAITVCSDKYDEYYLQNMIIL